MIGNNVMGLLQEIKHPNEFCELELIREMQGLHELFPQLLILADEGLIENGIVDGIFAEEGLVGSFG